MILSTNQVKSVRNKLNKLEVVFSFTSSDIQEAAKLYTSYDLEGICNQVIKNMSVLSTEVQNQPEEIMNQPSPIELRNPANSAVISMAVEYAEIELSDAEFIEVYNNFGDTTDIKLKDVLSYIDKVVSNRLDTEQQETLEALAKLKQNIQQKSSRNVATFNQSVANILEGSAKQRTQAYQQWVTVFEQSAKKL